jgi:Na+/H+ antiporter NhaD/arsenite permease-like protein
MPRRSISAGVEVNRKLAVRSMVTFLAFIAALLLGAPMDLAAVTSAAVLLVWINRPPSLTFKDIDWSLLVFFAGLFVVVEGFAKSNEAFLAKFLSQMGTQINAVTTAKVSAVTVLGSNVFSNVPFVLIARHWVDHTSNPRFIWLLLALTSTFAGNLTLFGSVANIIVAQRAQGRATLTFADFLYAGIPVTFVTTAIGVAMLYALKLLGWA